MVIGTISVRFRMSLEMRPASLAGLNIRERRIEPTALRQQSQ